jgi:hypothetical protein
VVGWLFSRSEKLARFSPNSDINSVKTNCQGLTLLLLVTSKENRLHLKVNNDASADLKLLTLNFQTS